MSIFNEAFLNYSEMSKINPRVTQVPPTNRINQLAKVTEILDKHFPFETIDVIETGGSHNWDDGMVGYYFAYLANKTNGKFTSVDIDPNLHQPVVNAYKIADPTFEINHITDDSLNLLKNPPYIPNLVHLDSWDVNLKDPLPSALHGWREFEAIESQMAPGSIIIIDDNWYKGEYTYWYTVDNATRQLLTEERIDIVYPSVGKGAHIFQWALPPNTHWDILDAGYKLIIQKR